MFWSRPETPSFRDGSADRDVTSGLAPFFREKPANSAGGAFGTALAFVDKRACATRDRRAGPKARSEVQRSERA